MPECAEKGILSSSMKNYTFSEHLFVRGAMGSPGIYRNDLNWFLHHPRFCAALYLASPSFYRQVRMRIDNGEMIPGKERLTLRKYINRYCFRPTPFGLFGWVAATRWGQAAPEDGEQPFYDTVVLPDETWRQRNPIFFPDGQAKGNEVTVNPTLYANLDEYRFIRSEVNQDGDKREYLLQGMPYHRLTESLLAFAGKGTTRDNICIFLREHSGCTADEALQYLHFLLDAQVLVPADRPKISGEIPMATNSELFITGLRQGVMGLVFPQSIPTAEALNELATKLSRQSAFAESEYGTKVFNVVLHRKDELYGLNQTDRQVLADGLHALSFMAASENSGSMVEFAKQFTTLYEERELPLLQALDPDTGIGYGEGQGQPENPMLRTVMVQETHEHATYVKWDNVRTVLLNAWHACTGNRSVTPEIQLNEAMLREMAADKKEAKPILGMSVLFRKAGDHLLIEHAGGVNSVALAGRFTPGNPQIAHAAREMAQALEEQNPEIIFAEVLHLSDPNTDNINHRERMYTWELPLTAGASANEQYCLQLSDLYVSVRQGKVWLRSGKHDRLVVPRLSSAYNYQLNKLPLFRFLIDLTYQYGRSNLSFSLREYFPGLAFYPRVSYRQAVLHPATWVLSTSMLQKLREVPIISLGNELARLQGLPAILRHVYFAEGDQQLLLDLEHTDDLVLFRSLLDGKTEVVLQEVIGASSSPGKDINRQYLSFLLPSKPLPWNAHKPAKATGPMEKRRFLPGSQWLYVKLYTSAGSANRMLLRLRPLLYMDYPAGRIIQWFFLRYEDTGEHLRLRMLIDPADTGTILSAMRKAVEESVENHLVREYQVSSYNRELERYRQAPYQLTEFYFWKSSELVAAFIAGHELYAGEKTMLFAMYTTYRCLVACWDKPTALLDFLRMGYEELLPEFDAGFLPDLDLRYREYRASIEAVLSRVDYMAGLRLQGRYISFIRSIKRLFQSIGSRDDPAYLLRSCLHMHLNRIFPVQGRKQEMVVYYLLYKWQRSVIARNGKKA